MPLTLLGKTINHLQYCYVGTTDLTFRFVVRARRFTPFMRGNDTVLCGHRASE